MHLSDRQDIEVALFIEALRRRHGYDFSGYAPASFKRRVIGAQEALGHPSISALTGEIVHDDSRLPLLIEKLSVPVSEFFRDPPAWRALKDEVLPELASHAHLNIWQAGCAHGEEVYSLAIWLQEAGLYERARIYATDLSEGALRQAQAGIYAESELVLYESNYRAGGGAALFSDYATAAYGHVKLMDSLKRHITFGMHNLVSDGVFGEMQLILCRNVLIYFNAELQERVLARFAESLGRGGWLCLGRGESLQTGAAARFQRLATQPCLFRKHARS